MKTDKTLNILIKKYPKLFCNELFCNKENVQLIHARADGKSILNTRYFMQSLLAHLYKMVLLKYGDCLTVQDFEKDLKGSHYGNK